MSSGRFQIDVRAPIAAAALVLCLSGCSVNSASKHYVLAEKLWTDGKYAAAVVEFDRATSLDPRGKLGQQALFRSAMTDTLFTGHYSEAIRKFSAYADTNPGEAAAWEAEKQIGEILYAKTEQYDLAVQHYRMLLAKQPGAPEAPEFLFRIGKSQFFLWQFDEAIKTYFELMRKYPATTWAEKAAYERGVSYFTRGERQTEGQNSSSEAFQDAMDAFSAFLKHHPQSALVPEAKFGIASCLEEMEQLDAAYHAYEELKDSYPSPGVIAIKLARIRERKAQRSR